MLVQALPHAAQFDVVPRAVSQPAAAVQSAKPALQPVGTHVPFVHAAPAFGNEQTVPQAPQFIVVAMLVSQPSSGSPLQLRQPSSQTGEQSKEPGVPEQAFVPWLFVQALPQPAQFDAVPSCVSQPDTELQSANPELHAPIVHVPVLHDALAFRKLQGTSQSPQFVSVRTSRSQPLSAMLSQLFQPASQVGEQPDVGLQAVEPCAFVQASLHERQFVTVPSGVSQLGAPATHSANPVVQVVTSHVPFTQVSFEFGMSHIAPHTLQSVSVRVDVSQPFAAFASQLSQPALHVN
jgi:hypothetical protein